MPNKLEDHKRHLILRVEIISAAWPWNPQIKLNKFVGFRFNGQAFTIAACL